MKNVSVGRSSIPHTSKYFVISTYFFKTPKRMTADNSSVIRQFELQKMKVPNALTIRSPVYPDSRGTLYEALHVLKINTCISNCTLKTKYPHMNHVIGPFSCGSDELVFLVRGKLFVVIIDNDNYENRDTVELTPGMILRVPASSIHAYIAMEEDTVFEVLRTCCNTNKKSYEWNDPKLNIQWPQMDLIHDTVLTDSKQVKERPMFAIMGANGLIGSSFVKEIEKRGYTWYKLRSRLHQQEALRNELMMIKPTVSVIISAGVGTRPNTKWCEDHKAETIDCNVTSQLAIANICQQLGLHLTIITTCGFYHYDEKHTLENGVGFNEDDEPNNLCNFYYKMRKSLEDILNKTGAIKNILNLRALFPFNDNITSASLIGKLLKFSKINCIKTSMTVLNDLVPLALDMIKDHDVGHINWVCEGTASNGDVLNAYKEIVDPSININAVELSQEDSRRMSNSAAYIVPNRLIQKFGIDKVPKLNESIKNIMLQIKARN